MSTLAAVSMPPSEGSALSPTLASPTMPDAARRYLVHVEFTPYSAERLARAVSYVTNTLKRIADCVPQVAYRSVHGDQCGWFIRSKLVAMQILAALESPAPSPFERPHGPMLASALTNDDTITVIELGENFAIRGRSRAAAWLQHH
jgi:hypothetical protein